MKCNLDLNSYKILALRKSELVTISGGIPWTAVVSGAVAVGATMAWVFEKGEELGRALAKKH